MAATMAMVLGSLGQCHLPVRAVAIRHIFHLVTVAGDIDERRLKLHQRVDAIVETANVAALERWHEFETGKRLLRTIEDVDDFHILSLFRDYGISGLRITFCDVFR